MPSPFPGMDPYLEAYWGDVHQRLITYASDALQEQLPDDLRARVQERVFVESPEEEGRSIYPDVCVTQRPYAQPRESGSTAVADYQAADPLVIQFPNDPITETFIEILDVRNGYRVVTSIEVLSLANKISKPGRELYERKQSELRAAKVNSVEIDLLRSGDDVIAAAREHTPPEYRSTYRIYVWRATRPDHIEFYRAPLKSPLPTIRIPLRPNDADVYLKLQSLLDQCYRNGGYDDIDYSREAMPPLKFEEATWAHELLKKHGLRQA